MKFEISVIIPVYNAIRFIEKAVLSAVNQDEVIEVLVIDDGSTDGSYELLQQLEKKHLKVKLFAHPRHVNKGRSATRNLGIIHASGNFIAFLDSDDYYLEHRFENDCKIFRDNLDTDGVYNAIGVNFYREATLEENDLLKLTTVTQKVEPDMLFEMLMKGNYGHFSLDGLTLNKSAFKMVGFFNEKLKVAEDTDIIIKMSLACNLRAGQLDKAVAMRGVHDSNIFQSKNIYEKTELTLYESLFSWSLEQQLPNPILNRFLERIWIVKRREQNNIWKEIIYNIELCLKTLSARTLSSHLEYNAISILFKRGIKRFQSF